MYYSVEKIENMAMCPEGMPDFELPEEMLYQTFRHLHAIRNLGVMKEDEFKRTRAKVIKSYELCEMRFRSSQKTQDMRVRFELELTNIRKNGCEHCKTAIGILDGIIQ